jgi:hypothetical protein
MREWQKISGSPLTLAAVAARPARSTQATAYILSAFASDAALVLAHLDFDEKSNEIPAVQALLRQLGLEQALLTVDPMHCQKNI